MTRSIRKNPPVLKHVANFWTMMQYPLAKKEWTYEEKIQQAKKAGFNAICWLALPELLPLCQKYEMDFICHIDVNAKTYRDKLEQARATQPARVNVQLCDHDTLPREAARVWIKFAAQAEKMGLKTDLEIHRDTSTETPEKTYEIAALYQKATGKKIRFSWDFSHLAVVKHLSPPYAKRLLVRPDLIQLGRQFHFRPFNGHHGQIPATDGKGHATAEFKSYLEFVDELLACWFKGARGGEVVYACPEFGPVGSGYGLSTDPDVWRDAIFVSKKVDDLWKANLKKSFRAG